jgi:hypothetical protein
MKERPNGGAPILCEVLHRDPAADAIEYSDHIAGLKAILERIDYLIFGLIGEEATQLTYRAVDFLMCSQPKAAIFAIAYSLPQNGRRF